jgi:release factor glutamine methyltransferase
MTTHHFIKNLYSQFNLQKREVDLLLCHMLKINTAGLFVYDKEIPTKLRQQISDKLKLRENGMPLAYISGSKQFWTLDLKVNQHTLIPRPETEQIIEIVLQQTEKGFNGKILDLGTGTGAIALSLAQERPLAKITATDISTKSLQVAEFNKNKYKLNNVNFLQSNWFDGITHAKFDYIISNPPYIAENDPHLSDLSYEPIMALTAKENGLSDLVHIIQQAKKYLKYGGMIVLEHGYNQHLQVQKHLQENCYNSVNTHYDLSRTPRITTANFQKVAINK